MNGVQTQPMRWYIQRRGETGGPYDESTIVGWIRTGMTDGLIRPEAAHPTAAWMPLSSCATFAVELGRGGAARPQAPKKSSTGTVTALLAVLFVVCLVVGAAYMGLRALIGERALTTGLASIAKSPAEVANEIVSVPAQTSRGRPMELPYDGEVELEVKVVKGKHVNVYVVEHLRLGRVR